MSEYRLTVDLDEVLKYMLTLSDRVGPRMAKAMDSAMEGSLLAVEEQVAARTPSNTGILRGSIAHDIYGKPPDFYGEVFTPESLYGMPVEYGRAPGRLPDVETLAYWVIRRGLAAGAEATRVAGAIAHYIARHGTKGAFMFRDGLAAAEPVVTQLWEAVAEQFVKELEN
jgi:hypothetical protein